MVVGLAGGQPYTLHYRLEIARSGLPLHLHCALEDGRQLDLTRSEGGEWTDAVKQPLPRLHGCTDVDIRATPFTNTLPLHRLGLRVGEDHEVRAVWVDVPSLEVQAACQRYTRTGDTTYRYENLKSGYSNEITADEPGLVTLCPAAFERLA